MKTATWALVVVSAATSASAQPPQPPALTQPVDSGPFDSKPFQSGPFETGHIATPLEGVASNPSLTMPGSERPPIFYHWHSSDLGHNRLLFEEPRLERQGISRVAPVQLAQSSAAFFSRSLLLPMNFLLGRHRLPSEPTAE